MQKAPHPAIPEPATGNALGPPSSAMGWAWTLVLVGALTIAYVDRQILSLMVDPIRTDLGITNSQFGLLQGFSFAVFYAVLGLPLGSLVDRYPRRSVIAAGMLFWCVATALCGAANRFAMLLAARIGVGAGEASLSPAAYSLLADLFPPARLGRALSVYVAGSGIGVGLSFLLGGALVEALSHARSVGVPLLGQLRTWQLVFLIVSLPGIPFAILLMFLNEPTRTVNPTFTDESWSAFLSFVWERAGMFAGFVIGLACVYAIPAAIYAWSAASLMRVYSLGPGKAGVFLGIATIPALFGGMLGAARLAEAEEHRGEGSAPLRVARTSCLLIVPCCALLAAAPSSFVAAAAVFLLLMLGSAPFGIAAASLQRVTPSAYRGRMSASYLLVMNLLGLGVGPLLPPLILDHAFKGNPAWTAVSLSLACGIFAALGAATLSIAIRGWRDANSLA